MMYSNKEALDKICKSVDAHKEDVSKRFYKIREEYLRAVKEYDRYLECEKCILKKYLEYMAAADDNDRNKIIKEVNLAYDEVKDILKSL